MKDNLHFLKKCLDEMIDKYKISAPQICFIDFLEKIFLEEKSETILYFGYVNNNADEYDNDADECDNDADKITETEYKITVDNKDVLVKMIDSKTFLESDKYNTLLLLAYLDDNITSINDTELHNLLVKIINDTAGNLILVLDVLVNKLIYFQENIIEQDSLNDFAKKNLVKFQTIVEFMNNIINCEFNIVQAYKKTENSKPLKNFYKYVFGGCVEKVDELELEEKTEANEFYNIKKMVTNVCESFISYLTLLKNN